LGPAKERRMGLDRQWVDERDRQKDKRVVGNGKLLVSLLSSATKESGESCAALLLLDVGSKAGKRL
jgi:hypothetical protein